MIVEIYSLKKSKHDKPCLVQLATKNKIKVNEVVERCPLQLDGPFTWNNLNALPLDFYDILIMMDWLEAHRIQLDCFIKTFDCIDEEGNS